MSHREVALIKEGKVFNIAAFPENWETILSPEQFGADTIVDYTDLEQKPAIGMTYNHDDGTFYASNEEK